MFTNLLLFLVIIAEFLGIPEIQNKFFSPPPNEPQKVLGEKSLPRINLTQIAPLPEKKSAQTPKTSAVSVLIIDLKTNQILYQKDPHEPNSIASITKIMSSIVALENFRLSETILVSSKSAFQTGSKMHLLPGERISLYELVAGMLIVSGNDAAAAFQEHFGKDRVVSLMNLKAVNLNLTKTKFIEAVGLEPGNISTANDLAILTRYALRNSEISQMVKTKKYTALSTDGQIQHPIQTTNRLLKQSPDIFGVKTGFTNESGNCLISAAIQHGHPIIAVVLGVPDYTARFVESRDFLDWAFANFKW